MSDMNCTYILWKFAWMGRVASMCVLEKFGYIKLHISGF